MKRIIHSKVNTTLAVLTVLLAIAVGIYGGATFTRSIVYNYTLTVAASSTDRTVELQYGVWPELSNINFFRTVRDSFIAERANFVEANLTAMTIKVYQEGVPVLTVPIKNKGKEGSWWETPSGLYRAEGKKENHFSSFGHVYMPWSIPFQGNFFIHGWPYHPDGTPVPEGYSGGCMRLEDSYAKQVYELVEVGMPILVFEDAQLHGATYPYTLKAPSLTAQSYLAVDLDSNFVLLANNTDDTQTTSVVHTLMAPLVASEHKNIEHTVRAPWSLEDDGSGIEPGTSYSLYDLFFPLLMQSSENALQMLAGNFGSQRFNTLMEAKAGALGMKHTKFIGVGTALTERSTAEDVFQLLKYLHTNRSFILDLSAGKTDVVTYGKPGLTVTSTHPLAKDTLFAGGVVDAVREGRPGADGATAAVQLVFASSSQPSTVGEADLVTILKLPFGREVRTVAFIVLDSKDPTHDTREMIAYVRRMYE